MVNSLYSVCHVRSLEARISTEIQVLDKDSFLSMCVFQQKTFFCYLRLQHFLRLPSSQCIQYAELIFHSVYAEYLPQGQSRYSITTSSSYLYMISFSDLQLSASEKSFRLSYETLTLLGIFVRRRSSPLRNSFGCRRRGFDSMLRGRFCTSHAFFLRYSFRRIHTTRGFADFVCFYFFASR